MTALQYSTDSATSSSVRRQLWRPIDSAPRDGTVVLVWTREGCQLACYYLGHSGRPGGWVEKDANYLLTEDTTGLPTHWMPLPAAPSLLDGTEPKTVKACGGKDR